jgi:glucosylceramidase
MTQPATERGNPFLEFAVLVTAVAVLMLAVVELHVSPRAALADDLAPAVATQLVAPPSPVAADWTITATSPVDAARRLSPIEPGAVDPATRTISIDLDRGGQEWIGVGGAFTDGSVDLLVGHDEALDLLFDPNHVDGARLDLGRLPLSATDFSATPWTWGWDDRSAVASPTAEARRAVGVVGEVLELRPDLRLVAAPWTAPADMIADDGGLAATAEAEYADLLRQQIEWLLAAGVPIGAVTLANEPGHLAEYPSMTVTDDQLIRLARTMRPVLDTNDVELWAVDHNWADRDRVDTVLAAAEFDAAAFHCYAGTPDQMSGLSVPAVITECTGTDDNWISTFGWDSRVLVTESIRAGATGLLMWNLAQAPDTVTLPGGCEDCRGLLTVDPVTGTIERGPEFYTLAHLSRAADPGAVRVETNRVDRLPTVAFVNPDGSVGVFGHNDTDQRQVIGLETTAGQGTTFEVGPWEMFSIRR